MDIQWYPGHMTKTRRMISENLKMVDAVCEILDARIPISSRNNDIAELSEDKPRLMVLNRTDLADSAKTSAMPKNISEWRQTAATQMRSTYLDLCTRAAT